MFKKFLVGALFAASLPNAAAARSQAQLDCVVRHAPAGLGDSLAAAMLAGDRTRLGPLQETLGRAIRPCVAANRMRDAEAESYYKYALARLPREALVRQLARSGFAAARIDAALSLGPGLANRSLQEMDEAESAQALAALKATGIDQAKLPPATWDKVTTYIDLTARMFRYSAAL